MEPMKKIYLDYAAATPVDPEVKAAMDPYFDKVYGNPSSTHSMGKEAFEAVEHARKQVAKRLNCTPEEIIFTSGGTESCNLAILGIAKNCKHIITTAIEHDSVLQPCQYLEEQGYSVTYLPVDDKGLVSVADVEKAIRKDTCLISIMYVNNEIGTITPLREFADVAQKHNVPLHTDACQAGLLNLDVVNLGLDLLTLNGAKMYGPKGVGMLYVRKGTKLNPIVFGSSQEHGLRSGTQNVPGIIGFAKGLELMQAEKDAELLALENLREKFVKSLLEIGDVIVNGHHVSRVPGIVSVSFKGIEAEALLGHLNEQGICASAGSACTSKHLEASHVLKAIGVAPDYIHGTVRFSLGKHTTEAELEITALKVKEIVGILRKAGAVRSK